jgi:hypothetical protein
MIRHISPGRATLFVSESVSVSVFEFVFVFEGERRVFGPRRRGVETMSGWLVDSERYRDSTIASTTGCAS